MPDDKTQKAPAFQFYPNDWLSSESIAMMSLAEQGAYLRLLCYDWMKDGIPDDDIKLARLSQLNEGWLNGGSDLLRPCFVVHPEKIGFLTNPRLLVEREKQKIWREKSIRGGKKSAASRRRSKALKGGSTLVGTKAQARGNSSSPSSPSPSSSGKNTDNKLSVSSEPKPLTQSKRIQWSVESGWIDIIEEDKTKWSEAFPACDIDRELAGMSVWLTSNPKKSRKSNYARFITTWLSRSQDRGGGLRSTQSPQHKTGYIPATDNDENDWEAIVKKQRSENVQGK